MEFLKELTASLLKYKDENALFYNGQFFSYEDLVAAISKIRGKIAELSNDEDTKIGLVTTPGLVPYAAIIAIWLEGKAYVPINPDVPVERNNFVLNSTETKIIIDNSAESDYAEQYQVINPDTLADNDRIILHITERSPEDLAYILFTSGTTGTPKGVPITFGNVDALVMAVNAEPTFNLNKDDRCLQMFELTFDFSVVAYIFPLLAGACLYTIPKDTIKYLYIYKLLSEHKLTVMTMVPSIINYLRPYFSQINVPSLRYCSFGGGALHADIAAEWQECIPNSLIFNYYGPTEFTVYSGFYPYSNTNKKSHNGIIAIGTPQKNTSYLLVDQSNTPVALNETGELCLAGPQITPGYWKNKEKNAISFFEHTNADGKSERYYKTGDLCIKDEDGDYLYVGRADFQVKIRGYRVELAEIEFNAKIKAAHKVNMVALDLVNKLGNAELGLAIEGDSFNTEPMITYMKTKMPDYMIPKHIQFVKEFPHSINGKVDRKKLKSFFNLT